MTGRAKEGVCVLELGHGLRTRLSLVHAPHGFLRCDDRPARSLNSDNIWQPTFAVHNQNKRNALLNFLLEIRVVVDNREVGVANPGVLDFGVQFPCLQEQNDSVGNTQST